MRRFAEITFSLILCATFGCAAAEPQAHTFISPDLVANPPARVLVVPFGASPGNGESAPDITQSVALALQSALNNDVVTAPARDERIAAESVLWERGRVDMAALIAARKHYMADAFLFGAVTHYRAYAPPLIGLKLRLISAHTGDVLWAAEGAFDARESAVHDRGVAYFNQSSLSDKLYGPDLVFVSPKHFAAFVAQEMLLPLKTQMMKCRPLARATP